MDNDAKNFREKINVFIPSGDVEEKITYRILEDVKHLPQEKIICIVEECLKKLPAKTIKDVMPNLISKAIESKKVSINDIFEEINELNKEKVQKKEEVQNKEVKVKQQPAVVEPEIQQVAATIEPKSMPKKKSFLDIADEYLKIK